MKKWSAILFIFVATMMLSSPVTSSGIESTQHNIRSWQNAKQMVKQAKDYIKAKGSQAYFQALADKKFYGPHFQMFAIDYRGNILAHPLAKLRGVNGWDFRDSDRVYMIRDMVKLAKTTGKGWVEYQSNHHQHGKMMPKLVYIERVNNKFFIGVGMDQLNVE